MAPSPHPAIRLMTLLRLSSFTLLSGIGWCIDFAIFNLLVGRGQPGFLANLASASVAVTFVLIAARKWIFRHHVETLPMTVAKYTAWNVVAISAASFGIKAIASGLQTWSWDGAATVVGQAVGHSVAPAVLMANTAKILITPVTMYANFVATGYIIERRIRFF